MDIQRKWLIIYLAKDNNFLSYAQKNQKDILPILPKQQDEFQTNLPILAKPHIKVNECKILK